MARLVIDPLLEDATNSPLDVWDSLDGSVATGAVDFPAAQLDTVTAGSINTEGDLIAARRHQNATRSITVEVLEPTDAAATNLITNPSFETGTSGWAAYQNGGTATLSRTNTVSRTGDYCAKLTATSAITDMGAVSSIAAPYAVTVTAGQQLSVTGYSRADSVSRNCRMIIAWYTAADAFISSTNGTIVANSTTAWTQVPVFTATAPGTTAKAAVYVSHNSIANGEIHYVDSVTAVIGTTTGATFDGDTPGCAWTGTAHASSSTRPAPGGPRFRAIIADLEAKAAKVALRGGTLRWVNDDGTPFTADLLAGDGLQVPIDIRYFTSNSATATFNFTALPYWRGDEVTMTSHTETTLPVLIFTETGIQGDVPALGRLVISADATAQETVFWGLQSANYSTDVDAVLFYHVEQGSAFSPAAANTGPAGATGPGANKTILNASLTASASTGDIAIPGKHVGRFRALVRVHVPATNTGTVSIRAVASTASGPDTEYPWVEIDPADEGFWVLADLGVLTAPDLPVTTPDFDVFVQAKSTVSGDDIHYDWLMLLPVDEAAGQATSATSGGVPLPGSGTLTVFHNGVLSEASGQGWVPAVYEGDYLRIPVGGTNGVRFIVKASRGRSSTNPFRDAGTDDIAGQLFYRPRYLTVR